MLETKEQKQYFTTVVVLIVILGLVTAFSRPNPEPTGPIAVKKHFDYNAYLASLKVDPVASQALLKKIIDEKDIELEVKNTLQVDRDIAIPEVAGVRTTSAVGKQPVEEYMKSVAVISSDYTKVIQGASQALFSQNLDSLTVENAEAGNKHAVEAMEALSVPSEVLPFHKALVNVIQSYGDALSVAKAYASNSEIDPWPSVYKDYYIINNQMAVADKQFKQLASAYGIQSLVISSPIHEDHFGLIPTAYAFGPTIVVGNIPEEIEKAIREGLGSAFANFATQFLNKLIVTIENNYKIANFLYYSDALVRGQYVNDYLKKYVNDPVDQQIVKRFIPQFSCGGANEDLKQVFKAKSDQYLGFDPSTVSPSDPQYYSKMAKMGDFLASPSGWELYYQQVAEDAKSESERAVDNELKSSGLKSPRDLVGTQIAASLNSITGSETATFIATLNLGVVNVDKVVSTIVSRVTYNLFNKFVFRGAVVYQEQNACVPIPQLQPIIPASDTGYQNPPPAPTENDLKDKYNVTP